MAVGWRCCDRLVPLLVLAHWRRPPAAAEAYRPDPALVAAAKKEGQVLIYTTLIVDQIVRPLIQAFQAQVPGIDVKFVRADSAGAGGAADQRGDAPTARRPTSGNWSTASAR